MIKRQVEHLDAAIRATTSGDDETRVEAVRRACRAARRTLALRPDAASLTEYRDPVPASTESALARLRQRARARAGRGP
jgi:hypothetical protein